MPTFIVIYEVFESAPLSGIGVSCSSNRMPPMVVASVQPQVGKLRRSPGKRPESFMRNIKANRGK